MADGSVIQDPAAMAQLIAQIVGSKGPGVPLGVSGAPLPPMVTNPDGTTIGYGSAGGGTVQTNMPVSPTKQDSPFLPPVAGSSDGSGGFPSTDKTPASKGDPSGGAVSSPGPLLAQRMPSPNDAIAGQIQTSMGQGVKVLMPNGNTVVVPPDQVPYALMAGGIVQQG